LALPLLWLSEAVEAEEKLGVIFIEQKKETTGRVVLPVTLFIILSARYKSKRVSIHHYSN